MKPIRVQELEMGLATRQRLSPYLWMVGSSLAFAGMATCAHAAGFYWSWTVVALARTGLCLLMALTLCWVADVELVWLKPATLWLRSLAGSVSLLCTFYALPRLPVADVLTLTNIFPLWVAMLSIPMLGQWPAPGVWVAIAVAITGVALVQKPHLAEGNLATLVALGGSFFTALAMIGLHRLAHLDARAVVVHFSMVGFLVCLAVTAATQDRLSQWNAAEQQGWLLLAGVGLFATLGQIGLTRAFATGAPAKVAVVGLVQVVFAAFLDHMLLNTDLDLVKIAGMIMVLMSTCFVMLQRPQTPDLAS
ncbi:MAG: EamA/RhaT family transporter [Gemmataceae bacterium]|mgnify:CR=1 FL=1